MIVVKNNFKSCYTHILVTNILLHSKLLRVTNTNFDGRTQRILPASSIGVWRKKKKV